MRFAGARACSVGSLQAAADVPSLPTYLLLGGKRGERRHLFGRRGLRGGGLRGWGWGTGGGEHDVGVGTVGTILQQPQWPGKGDSNEDHALTGRQNLSPTHTYARAHTHTQK